ncbi:MAG TPA: sigma-54 dependent transcriptional regulator [Planctomycetota bacterium]|nr:sigma-54 dependent transcriptional regulator [Planctomycetota bacterium]
MPRLLVVDDDAHIRQALVDRFAARKFDVHSAGSGREALTRITNEHPDVVLLDLQLPEGDGFWVLKQLREEGAETTVVVITAFGTVDKAVQAMKEGAYDFIQKPFEPALVEETVRRALERSSLRRTVRAQAAEPVVIGLAAALETAKKAAKSDATVLLLGESGTGKEVIARTIHRSGPFVAVNAAALAETLLESELFGHEKGAFTGAVARRAGKFELAHGGTLFLDEIGDITPALQAKLLRVLQERAFERVGGTETITVDVRVIAATNRDLRKRVAEGAFREDLFYRLNVLSITLAPLRERRADIRPLAEHVLRELKPGVAFGPGVMEAFERYDWPGNVRELRNAIERAVALHEGEAIGPGDLPPELLLSGSLPPDSFHGQVEDFRRRLIRETLARFGGNQTRAAEALKLQRTYLARLIRQLGI